MCNRFVHTVNMGELLLDQETMVSSETALQGLGKQVTFRTHAITQQLAPQVLEEWKAWATQRTQVFQRTSSAVEGRNGSLAQMQHNQRGLPKHRYKVWAVLHNFDCRAADGTTPAARFFRRTFPDLFETVLAQKEVLAGFRQVRSIPILERIGHRLCTVALWPTIQR